VTTDPLSVAGRDGVFVIDKPVGLTSQQVVGRVRHRLAEQAGIAAKKIKAGHAGTLDPMATGVLIVGVNKATRLLGYIAGTDKQYLATIRLGQATTTDDAEGEPVGDPVDATGLSDQVIRQAIAMFTGDISQVPSSVSAIKVDGKRAYAMVRAGEAVELAPRAVTVSRFEVLTRRDDGPFCDLDVVVDCSTGTYVRALARDLGRQLGVGGHLTSLRRTRVGRFEVDAGVGIDVVTWGDIEGIAKVARFSFPAVDVDAAGVADVSHGRSLAVPVPNDPTAVFGPSGEFLALYRPDGDEAAPVAVFIGGDAR